MPDEPVLALTGVRMDVAAFVGVAPRGPARLPAFAAPWADPPRGPAAPLAPLRSVAVPVDSWDAYRRLYGGFEGPGLLPYAVAAFFENGGRRAYVVRVVHDYGEGRPENEQGTASGSVPGATPRSGGTLKLRARSEGRWGNRLTASLSFRTRPLAFGDGAREGITVSRDVPEGAGTLLRAWFESGPPELVFVTDTASLWRPDRPVRERRLIFGAPLSAPPRRVEVVEATLYVADAADDGIGRAEVHEGLGLGARHPRFAAAQLYRDSVLVHPDPAWIGDDLVPDDPFLRAPPDPARGWFCCARDTVGLAGARTRSGGPLTLTSLAPAGPRRRLCAALSFQARPLACLDRAPSSVTVAAGVREGAGTLLRAWLPAKPGEPAPPPGLRVATAAEDTAQGRRLRFDPPLAAVPLRVEVVEAALRLSGTTREDEDGEESYEGVGLGAVHPRSLAAQLAGSRLAEPAGGWTGEDLLPDDPFLRFPPPPGGAQFTCGRDRYPALVPGDFFDPSWTPGDEQPRGGIHALAEVDEVAVLVVPDLYSPDALPREGEAPDLPDEAGAAFARCPDAPRDAPPDPGPVCADGLPAEADGAEDDLYGLRLDPRDPGSLAAIAELQQAVVELTELLERWVVLLDVPPRLGERQALEWRARFGSAYAAAYHPWLNVARPDDRRDPLVAVNPSAFAAGIVAAQEAAFGVQHGPANLLAAGAVSAADRVDRARHDALHQAGINVFVPERDGIRLTAARTLSYDPQWRQLSVRRLVSMLRRALEVQMQWTVFEPNDEALREELTRLLEGYLRALFRAGAFRGSAPDEGFFVRCDEELNPQPSIDLGRLVCHVGVAPTEPLEFILLRLAREGDGTLLVEG